MSIRVLATDIPHKYIYIQEGEFEIDPGFFKKKWRYKVGDLTSLKIIDSDSSTRMGEAIGGAVIGNAIAGSKGAIVGAIAAGGGKRVTFEAKFRDGKTLIAECIYESYQSVWANKKRLELLQSKGITAHQYEHFKQERIRKRNRNAIIFWSIFGLIVWFIMSHAQN